MTFRKIDTVRGKENIDRCDFLQKPITSIHFGESLRKLANGYLANKRTYRICHREVENYSVTNSFGIVMVIVKLSFDNITNSVKGRFFT